MYLKIEVEDGNLLKVYAFGIRDAGKKFDVLKYVLNQIYSSLPNKTLITLAYIYPSLTICLPCRSGLKDLREKLITQMKKYDFNPKGKYVRRHYSFSSPDKFKREWTWETHSEHIMKNLTRGNWDPSRWDIFCTVEN